MTWSFHAYHSAMNCLSFSHWWIIFQLCAWFSSCLSYLPYFFLLYTTVVYNYSYCLECLVMLWQHTISYRETALAILSEKNGLTALNRSKTPTPLHLLVKEMPGKVHVCSFNRNWRSSSVEGCVAFGSYCKSVRNVGWVNNWRRQYVYHVLATWLFNMHVCIQ